MKLRKELGQYIVKSKALLRRIVNYAELNEDDIVLEVGCGTGGLTRFLLEKCKVIGIEKDKRFVDLLRKKFYYEIETGKFQLIHGDALKIDFPKFTKFVSNIPFQISSPLTFKLFKYRFELAIIMYQREFAERLIREDSRLGVISKAYCKAEILEFVKPHVFKPRPAVEAAVVKIIPEPVINVKNLKLFEEFVTFAFSMKRKRMGKIVDEWNEKNDIKIKIIDQEISKKRPEELGAKVFAQIVDSSVM